MIRKSAFGVRLSYLYLSLPVLIFLVGWLRWYYAVPALCALAAGLFSAWRHAPKLWVPAINGKVLRTGVFVFALAVLMVVLSGIGKTMYQNNDLYWRNAIFDTLMDHPFPVRDLSADGESVTLVYYISFWLPAALVGKLLGSTAGYVFLALWTVLGLLLFFHLVSSYLKRFRLWPFLLFFAFSGLDLVILLMKGDFANALDPIAHLEWNLAAFQYSSFTTQLFWVFNQALPAWIAVALLVQTESNRSLAFLLSLTLLSSTLPFIGMIPLALVLAFTRRYEGDGKIAWWKAWAKDTLTWENILCGGSIALISVCYLFSNGRASGGGFGLVFRLFNSPLKFLFSYGIFVAAEFGAYYLLIFPYRRKDRLFLTSLISLVVLPFFTVGIGLDFCMRASIPSLLILFLMVAKTLPEAWRDRKKLVLIPLILCLLIGAKTPWNEVSRSVVKTAQGVIDAGTFDLLHAEGEENFVADDTSFFFQYLARKA